MSARGHRLIIEIEIGDLPPDGDSAQTSALHIALWKPLVNALSTGISHGDIVVAGKKVGHYHVQPTVQQMINQRKESERA